MLVDRGLEAHVLTDEDELARGALEAEFGLDRGELSGGVEAVDAARAVADLMRPLSAAR